LDDVLGGDYRGHLPESSMSLPPDLLDFEPVAPHYATMKDGTKVWVGPAVAEIEAVREELRIANVRISVCRRVLMGQPSPGTLELAIAALDFVPSGKR
jgi:hypothetical protein